MAEPIERAGAWWQQRGDGTWLRWNEGAQLWEEQPSGPPPPGVEHASEPAGWAQGRAVGVNAVDNADNADKARQGARRMTIIAFVLAVAAIFLLPILFGPAGAILGGIAYSRGDKLGLVALIAAILATIAGMILAYFIATNVDTTTSTWPFP